MSRRANNNSDSRRFYDWIDASHEDFVIAQILLREDKCFNGCAFHCQQCIEKALKAFILLNDQKLLDGHNLTWLCKQAMKIDSDFKNWIDETILLNKCYIETRYPTDLAIEPSHKDIQYLYKMTRDMFNYICLLVDVEY